MAESVPQRFVRWRLEELLVKYPGLRLVPTTGQRVRLAGTLTFHAQPGGLERVDDKYEVEVTVPDEYMGDVIGELNSRRGKIQNLEARQGLQVISAQVPMAEMFGYATDIRSATQGRGNYTMHFSQYEEVPKGIGEELVARISGTIGR